MKKNIKVLFVVLLIVGGFILSGCDKKTNSNESSSKENLKEKNYSGTFKSDDSSYIEITKDNDKYKATISIYRLTTFDNCTVDEIRDDILTISGIDPNNNPIKFSFNFATKSLTVIDSTWPLLENGTRFDFD